MSPTERTTYLASWAAIATFVVAAFGLYFEIRVFHRLGEPATA